MSSKISQIIPFTYIRFGVYFLYGASHVAGLSVRKMRAYLGSTPRKYRGAEGLPEVQKPLLEHTKKKRRQRREEMTTENQTKIETGDISAIEVECSHCHVTSVFPLAECSRIDSRCPHCEKKWFDAKEDARDKTVCPAADNLKAIAANLSLLSGTRIDVHAKIRIHLTPQLTRGVSNHTSR